MSEACCSAETGEETEVEAPSFWRLRTVQAAVASGILLAGGLVASSAGLRTVSVAAEIAALAAGGWTFVPGSLANLVRGRLGVGTLMTIAAAGAVLLGDVGEAAALAFLFSISESLEHYSLVRARRGLRSLLELVPERALVRRGGNEIEVDPAGLRPGDLLLVRPGERVATDGVVLTGHSTLDQSAITGESLSVECEPGRTVFAASINGGGILEIQVTAATADNSLARIVHIVEEAQERKGDGQRLAERVARPLVPGVMILATLIAVAGSMLGDPAVWVYRALVVLVAAAPCAFALSVPVTAVAAIGAATRGGVLIKGGAALEALAKVRIVAFDKTGTLTRNEPAVIEVLAAPGVSQRQVLQMAAALESRSKHPLAAAILAAAPSEQLHADDVVAAPGRGLAGWIGGNQARLGKPGFVAVGEMEEEVSRLQGSGCTVVLVELNGATLGAIAVRDELRPEAADVIASLRRIGVKKVAMLTGDNRATADALGCSAGVDTVKAELLPEDKARIVSELRSEGSVAMVGDGINDAPALAGADVGIAMAAVGVDAAIEAADVALMGPSLAHLPVVLMHARRAGRIMRQNLALSATILLVLVPLAAFGVLGLATVVVAHELAEVLVIGNGIRAGRIASGSVQRNSSPVANDLRKSTPEPLLR